MTQAEINAAYYTALWVDGAASAACWLHYGADVNYRSSDPEPMCPPVYVAIYRRDRRIMRLLIEYGVDVNAVDTTHHHRRSALTEARAQMMPDMASMLVEAGAK